MPAPKKLLLLSDLMLLAVAVVWGSSYGIVKSALVFYPVLGLLTLRFGITFVVLSPTLAGLRRTDAATLRGVLGTGVLLLGIFLCETFGHAFELHADFQRLGETVARLYLDHIGVVIAEGFLGLELQLGLKAGFMAFERFLDLGERAIISAVQVNHRLIRLLDQIALRIRQLVHHGYHRVLSDFQFLTP